MNTPIAHFIYIGSGSLRFYKWLLVDLRAAKRAIAFILGSVSAICADFLSVHDSNENTKAKPARAEGYVYYNITRVTIPLSVGGGLHSTNSFKSVKETSVCKDESLITFHGDTIRSYRLVSCAIAGVG